MPEKLEIINHKARMKGYKNKVQKSTRTKKKYMIRNNEGRLIHFGAVGYEDWLDHGDKKRRDNYRKRHVAVKLKDGRIAHKVFGSASHLSYYLLW